MNSAKRVFENEIRFFDNDAHVDPRGIFKKLLRTTELESYKFENFFLTENFSRGTVRGLHFQVEPFSEYKMVSCVSGKIFDVVVDIRLKSATFGTWAGYPLDASTNKSLLIPPGFAHGYQTLENNSNVFYAISNQYSESHARVITPNDSTLAIDWPLQIELISNRDSEGLTLIEYKAAGNQSI